MLPAAQGAELKPATLDAFNRYVQQQEARLSRNALGSTGFLWLDQSADHRRRAREGAVLVSPYQSGEVRVSGGLIHHWVGAMFIPGATLEATLALMNRCGDHMNLYNPGVIETKLLSRNGNECRTAMRMVNRRIVTVVYDAEYDIRSYTLDRSRWYSEARSTRIHEVEDAGEPSERRLPDGSGHGFLWRVNTFSRFQERDGGVYAECEVVSLSRGYPFGMAWVIRPLAREVPRDSITRTLTSMRAAVTALRADTASLPHSM
ncbi:MAG: hypothetical protein ACM336_10445 [Acidobacteriota bacterium]